MVEPLSVTAFILAIGSLVVTLVKTIVEAVSKSSCVSTSIKTSKSGSITNKRSEFRGSSDDEEA